jgi:hypothetical protein
VSDDSTGRSSFRTLRQRERTSRNVELEKGQSTISNEAFIKSAGLLAILSTVGYALTLHNADRVFYAWAGLIATVLAGPAYVGAYLFLKNDENETLARLGIFLMMTGLPLVAGIYVCAYVDAILDVDVYRSAAGVMILIAINGGSTLSYGLGVLFLSLASRRTALPRWFQWLGIVSGTLGLFWIGFHWLPHFKDGEIGFFIPVVGLLLSLVWQLILGVHMLRENQ